MPTAAAASRADTAPPVPGRDTGPFTLDWQQDGWGSPNDWKIRLARLAYRYRAAPWVLGWVSGAGAAAMATCRWVDPVGQLCRPEVPLGMWWSAFAGLLGVWLLSSALIVAVSGWFGLGFRSAAWGAASLFGTVARTLRARWRVLLLMAFSLVLVQANFDELKKGLGPDSDWSLLAAVLVGLIAIFLVALLWAGYQVRNRIIVQEFKSYTDGKELEACAKGLSERLCGELAGLAQLYDLINRTQGSRTRKVYSASIDVQDAGSLLQSAVSAEATLDLKFFKVPIGAVLALSSRLLQGARLAGSLHEYGGRLVLVAQMTGAGREAGRTWRVQTEDLEEEDRSKPLPLVLSAMLEQLAYRLAADLVTVGSRKWRAVRSFTKGLRSYRDSQRTRNESLCRLRDAERAFLEALSEDEGFAQCHYNLGIVYREMDEREAAEAAFRRALQADVEPSRTCYALAVGYFHEERYTDALWFSKNAIRIRPDDANAWHLRAVSLYYGWVKPEAEAGRPVRKELWDEVLEAEGLAVGIAWRDFCRWQMKGLPPDAAEAGFSSEGTTRQTAATFAGSLADGLVLRDAPFRQEDAGPTAGEGPEVVGRGLRTRRRRRTRLTRRAWRVFRQAARLEPADAENHFAWADALWTAGDLMGATQVLDRVFAGRLETDERIDFWATLLAAHAGLMALRPTEQDHREIAQDAYGYLLDFIAIADGGTAAALAGPLEKAQKRLEQALAWATKEPERAGEDEAVRIDRLVEDLAWRPGETAAEYSRRLVARAPQPLPGAAFYLWRLRSVRGFLKELVERLGHHASEEGHRVWPEPWRVLERHREGKAAHLQARLEALDQAGLLSGEEDEHTPGLPRLVMAQRKDWGWACAQVAWSFGLEHLEQGSPRPVPARRCLEAVLWELTSGREHCRQVVEQGLRSRLAEAYLLEARAVKKAGDLERWTDLLRRGVVEAEQAAALKPEGVVEHEILGRLYFELADYERAEAEWRVLLILEPGSEVLNLLAESSWRRGLELSTASARRKALSRAVMSFEKARELIENDPNGSPEAHGQVHFWLGVFHRELLHFDQAIFHHKIAWSLGVRPLEAQTSLGWSYLEARMYGEAEATFEAVWKEARRAFARRLKSGDTRHEADPGQEMPLDEIALRIHLGRALLDAELGVNLRRAERLVWMAFRHAGGVRSYKRAELLARCRECLGLVRLRMHELQTGSRADLDAATRHLRRALQLHARCDSYLLLARVHLNRAKASPKIRTKELEQAREAAERARRADLRGRRREEVESLLRRIEAEGPTAKAA